jgi:(p)ppGpp synthase/HD superfamily hydrolase
MAALLHDVMEDTDITKAEIAERFGKVVAELVDGVSKLDKIEFQSILRRRPRTSARCCWRWRATCASS